MRSQKNNFVTEEVLHLATDQKSYQRVATRQQSQIMNLKTTYLQENPTEQTITQMSITEMERRQLYIYYHILLNYSLCSNSPITSTIYIYIYIYIYTLDLNTVKIYIISSLIVNGPRHSRATMYSDQLTNLLRFIHLFNSY